MTFRIGIISDTHGLLRGRRRSVAWLASITSFMAATSDVPKS
jgi:hypothetical protein